jgi:hypothetical protein
VSALVVVIFAVVKFTEGAWLVVLLFPLGWFALMRLNRQYRREARALELATAAVGKDPTRMHYPRHVVLVFVDRLDLAVLRALRYAGSLRPTDLRAVHLSLDNAASGQLEREWIEHGLGDGVPLQVIECADRRLIRAAGEVALNAVISDRSEVTALLPRRTFRRLSQRLLHDRTADRIAEALGRIPHVSATIVPFDTTLPRDAVEHIEARQEQASREPALAEVRVSSGGTHREGAVTVPATPAGQPRADGTVAIGDVTWRQRVTIEGRVKQVQVGTTGGKSLEVQVFDETGGVRLLFFGRTRIPGLEPGAVLRASGMVGEYKGHLALANPKYELVGPA